MECFLFSLFFIFIYTRWNRINGSNSKQTTTVICTPNSIFINNTAKSYIQNIDFLELHRDSERACVCVHKNQYPFSYKEEYLRTALFLFFEWLNGGGLHFLLWLLLLLLLLAYTRGCAPAHRVPSYSHRHRRFHSA